MSRAFLEKFNNFTNNCLVDNAKALANTTSQLAARGCINGESQRPAPVPKAHALAAQAPRNSSLVNVFAIGGSQNRRRLRQFGMLNSTFGDNADACSWDKLFKRSQDVNTKCCPKPSMCKVRPPSILI